MPHCVTESYFGVCMSRALVRELQGKARSRQFATPCHGANRLFAMVQGLTNTPTVPKPD